MNLIDLHSITLKINNSADSASSASIEQTSHAHDDALVCMNEIEAMN